MLNTFLSLLPVCNVGRTKPSFTTLSLSSGPQFWQHDIISVYKATDNHRLCIGTKECRSHCSRSHLAVLRVSKSHFLLSPGQVLTGFSHRASPQRLQPSLGEAFQFFFFLAEFTQNQDELCRAHKDLHGWDDPNSTQTGRLMTTSLCGDETALMWPPSGG